MKTRYLMLAALLAPAAARAQVIPPSPQVTAVFARMDANAAAITAPSERQRWSTNVAMWQLVLNKTGPMTVADYDTLDKLLADMRANVAQIAPSAEKDRWTANLALWDTFVRAGLCEPKRVPMPATAIPILEANVKAIAEPLERQRWRANLELWRIAVANQP